MHASGKKFMLKNTTAASLLSSPFLSKQPSRMTETRKPAGSDSVAGYPDLHPLTVFLVITFRLKTFYHLAPLPSFLVVTTPHSQSVSTFIQKT